VFNSNEGLVVLHASISAETNALAFFRRPLATKKRKVFFTLSSGADVFGAPTSAEPVTEEGWAAFKEEKPGEDLTDVSSILSLMNWQSKLACLSLTRPST
jgi:hypothetical protein